MFISFFFYKMFEDSFMYLHSMVELVKDPFQFSVWCAIYRASWDPFKKNTLLRFITFMCTIAVLFSNNKSSSYDSGPSPAHSEPSKGKWNRQMCPNTRSTVSTSFFFLWGFLYSFLLLILKYPLTFQEQNLISRNNPPLSLIEQFECILTHSLSLRHSSFFF